jgi:hypothetical protein
MLVMQYIREGVTRPLPRPPDGKLSQGCGTMIIGKVENAIGPSFGLLLIIICWVHVVQAELQYKVP